MAIYENFFSIFCNEIKSNKNFPDYSMLGCKKGDCDYVVAPYIFAKLCNNWKDKFCDNAVISLHNYATNRNYATNHSYVRMYSR